MQNQIQVLPQTDPGLAAVLQLAHQTHKAFIMWREQHPNDLFSRSHWDDIDNIDSEMIALKCGIAELIGDSLVDHLE